jgi:hypothetical protein
VTRCDLRANRADLHVCCSPCAARRQSARRAEPSATGPRANRRRISACCPAGARASPSAGDTSALPTALLLGLRDFRCAAWVAGDCTAIDDASSLVVRLAIDIAIARIPDISLWFVYVYTFFWIVYRRIRIGPYLIASPIEPLLVFPLYMYQVRYALFSQTVA